MDTSYTSLCNFYKKECDFLKDGIPPCCVTNMVEILQQVSSILTEYSIPFFLTCGTLLGHERHGGMIPWDNDIDLMCFVEDIDFVEYLCRKNIKKHIVLRSTGGGIDEKYPQYDYICIQYSKHNKVHVDIGFLASINKELLIDSTEHQANVLEESDDLTLFKQWIYPKKLLFPLKSATFYGVDCFIPNKSRDLLKYMYGDDVFKYAYVRKEDRPGTMDNLHKSTITTFIPAPILKTKTIKQEPSRIIYKAFIINLLGRNDRLHWAMNQCDNVGIHAERVVATEGNDLDINKLVEDGLINRNEGYNMHNNEYACYFSHLDCMSRIAKDQDDSHLYMILEDDIEFNDNFNDILEYNEDFIRKNDGIYLLGGSLYDKEQINKINNNIYETGLNTGTWAYIINPKTARIVLGNTFPIIYPIDLVVTTFDAKKYPIQKSHEDKLHDKINTYRVFDNANTTDERFGIVKEIGTSHNDSTSSQEFYKGKAKYELEKYIHKRNKYILRFLIIFQLLVLISILCYRYYKNRK